MKSTPFGVAKNRKEENRMNEALAQGLSILIAFAICAIIVHLSRTIDLWNRKRQQNEKAYRIFYLESELKRAPSIYEYPALLTEYIDLLVRLNLKPQEVYRKVAQMQKECLANHSNDSFKFNDLDLQDPDDK